MEEEPGINDPPQTIFGFGGFCLLVAVVAFAIQQGCSVTGNPTSWAWGVVWFGVVIIAAIAGVWLWDKTASRHWIEKTIFSVFILLFVGRFSYDPIVEQYRKEHPPEVARQVKPEPIPQPIPIPVTLEVKKEPSSAKRTSERKQEAIPKTKQPVPVPPPAQTVNAPGGIGSIGGTVVNPTVNNFAPPPAILSAAIERLPGDITGKRITKVRITTDRIMPSAIVGVVLSGPFDATREWFGKHGASLEGSGVHQIDIKLPLSQGGQPVPNSIAFIINLPSAFIPGQTLVFTVQSDSDLDVVSAVPIGVAR